VKPKQEHLLAQAVAEAARDPEFGRALRSAIDKTLPKKRRRRQPAVVDVFAAYERGGEAELHGAMAPLTVDEQLSNAGWTCFVPPPFPDRIVCGNPGLGLPLPPPDPEGPPAFNAFVFDREGNFRGTEHLTRADLFAGQPCPQSAWCSSRRSATTNASTSRRRRNRVRVLRRHRPCEMVGAASTAGGEEKVD
jgi:hypothetical protein